MWRGKNNAFNQLRADTLAWLNEFVYLAQYRVSNLRGSTDILIYPLRQVFVPKAPQRVSKPATIDVMEQQYMAQHHAKRKLARRGAKQSASTGDEPPVDPPVDPPRSSTQPLQDLSAAKSDQKDDDDLDGKRDGCKGKEAYQSGDDDISSRRIQGRDETEIEGSDTRGGKLADADGEEGGHHIMVGENKGVEYGSEDVSGLSRGKPDSDGVKRIRESGTVGLDKTSGMVGGEETSGTIGVEGDRMSGGNAEDDGVAQTQQHQSLSSMSPAPEDGPGAFSLRPTDRLGRWLTRLGTMFYTYKVSTRRERRLLYS